MMWDAECSCKPRPHFYSLREAGREIATDTEIPRERKREGGERHRKRGRERGRCAAFFSPLSVLSFSFLTGRYVGYLSRTHRAHLRGSDLRTREAESGDRARAARSPTMMKMMVRAASLCFLYIGVCKPERIHDGDGGGPLSAWARCPVTGIE